MTDPAAPPQDRKRSPSWAMTISWTLICAAIALGLYANYIGAPFHGSFGSAPRCVRDDTCTSAQIQTALDRENRLLFGAFVAFLLAVIVHLMATPGRIEPRRDLTAPWLRSVVAVVIAAALVVALVVPFLVLAFSGQTAGVILLVMLGTFMVVAVPCLTHSATWTRPRRAKLAATAATLAAPVAGLVVGLGPVPDNEMLNTIKSGAMVVATLALLVAGHRLTMIVGQSRTAEAQSSSVAS